jgi:cytochrome c oxidase assembly protein subunit 15
MAAIIMSSAFLRLTTMGIGCEPWPACYGQTRAENSAQANQSTIGVSSGVGIARLLHRASAMLVAVLAVLVFLLSLVQGVRTRGNVALASIALVLTVMLAVVGRVSATLLVPAVGMANLLGGFAMLACFWLLHLNNLPRAQTTNSRSTRYRSMALVVLAVFVTQTATGALITVTYSATLCPSLWVCDGAPIGTSTLVSRLDPFAKLQADTAGKVIPAMAAADVQSVHRVSGGVTAALIAALGVWLLLAVRQRALGLGLLILGCTEAALGLVMATHDFPLVAALAHNSVAAVLLLMLLTLAWRGTAR